MYRPWHGHILRLADFAVHLEKFQHFVVTEVTRWNSHAIAVLGGSLMQDTVVRPEE